jgi:hypothetical protein
MDGVQIALDATGVGEVVNHILDFAIGAMLLLYGMIKKLWTGKKLLVLLATFLGEQIPFVNALPFWTLDVRNLYSETITPEEKEAMRQQEIEDFSIYQPHNKDGVRAPSGSQPNNMAAGPANKDGLRLPGGGLQPTKTQMVDIKPPLAA